MRGFSCKRQNYWTQFRWLWLFLATAFPVVYTGYWGSENCGNVPSKLHVRTSALFSIPTVGNEQLQVWKCLQCYNITRICSKDFQFVDVRLQKALPASRNCQYIGECVKRSHQSAGNSNFLYVELPTFSSGIFRVVLVFFYPHPFRVSNKSVSCMGTIGRKNQRINEASSSYILGLLKMHQYWKCHRYCHNLM